MTDDTNLVLEHLRHIRARADKIDLGIEEVKTRLTTLEAGQGAILSHIGHQATTSAQQQLGLDRLAARVELIERRLELADGP